MWQLRFEQRAKKKMRNTVSYRQWIINFYSYSNTYRNDNSIPALCHRFENLLRISVVLDEVLLVACLLMISLLLLSLLVFFFFAQIMNFIVWPCRSVCVCALALHIGWAYICLEQSTTQNVQKCIWICIIARIQEIKSSCSYINMCAERKSFVFPQYTALFSSSFSFARLHGTKKAQYTDICVTFLRQFLVRSNNNTK